jgi:hypothetical protein
MPTIRRFRPALARLTVLFASAAIFAAPPSSVRAQSLQSLPAKLSDSLYWALVTNFSEANGYFRSDNFVSNETTYQWVIPELLRTTKPGGVYLGVGPDQNFTYIIALHPKIAFIFDVRRQNLLTHLMYKALLEQSSDRADFVAHLFARTRPAGLDSTSTPEAMFAAFAAVAWDSVASRKNLAAINERLTKTHGFTLSPEDLGGIAYAYNAFTEAGPDITYNFSPAHGQIYGYGRGRMPSYGELQVATDSAGVHRGYLASEANFRALKTLETNNLVVPLVGDFAGPKAIRAVGTYLKEHGATVTAFYLSNVEQYLFQGDGDQWRRFYTNVGTLPLDSTSTFIRSVFNGMSVYRSAGPVMRAQQMLASMLDQVRRFNEGKLASYQDVIQTSR